MLADNATHGKDNPTLRVQSLSPARMKWCIGGHPGSDPDWKVETVGLWLWDSGLHTHLAASLLGLNPFEPSEGSFPSPKPEAHCRGWLLPAEWRRNTICKNARFQTRKQEAGSQDWGCLTSGIFSSFSDAHTKHTHTHRYVSWWKTSLLSMSHDPNSLKVLL